MSESRIKRLWKNRISHQLHGFHIPTCIAPIIQQEDSSSNDSTALDMPPALPQHHRPTPTEKKLWRKPLPNDCPSFDFQISEKTMVEEQEGRARENSPLLMSEKTEIPARVQSRDYENIPNLEAQLERACKNEKAVLLTKLLEKQRHKQCI